MAAANASAVIYSLLETAKANGLEPYPWLRRVLRDLPAVKTVDDVAALLPWNMKEFSYPGFNQRRAFLNSMGLMDRLPFTAS